MLPRISILVPFLVVAALAADESLPTDANVNQTPIAMNPVVVTASLDQAREGIVPSLGASTFYITSDQIALQPLGVNAPFNDLILHAPGVAQEIVTLFTVV